MILSKSFEISVLAVSLTLTACATKNTKQEDAPQKKQESPAASEGETAKKKASYPFLKASSEDQLVAAPAGKSSYFLQYKNPGSKNTCYLLPNPDGTVVEQTLCSGSDSEVIEKLEAYGFCGKTQATEGEGSVDLRNEIPCDTAAEIRTELEKNLVFGHDGLHLYHEDLVIACAQKECKDSAVTAEICQETAEIQAKVVKGEPVNSIARLYSDAELDAVGACAASVYSN